MTTEKNQRATWDDYFLGITRAVAVRADCTRRAVGAVIVDTDHRIIGTGYNGSPPGGPSCLKGECPRGQHFAACAGDSKCLHKPGFCNPRCACGNTWPCPESVAPGSSYDTGPGQCEAVHAEANALLFSRTSVKGAALYCTDEPCGGCMRLIKGAGIIRVIWPDGSWQQDRNIPSTVPRLPEGGYRRIEVPELPRDPVFTARNQKRYPVDDPPCCERLGCGHGFDMHFYSLTEDQKDKHGACSLGCGCPEPLYPEPRTPRA